MAALRAHKRQQNPTPAAQTARARALCQVRFPAGSCAWRAVWERSASNGSRLGRAARHSSAMSPLPPPRGRGSPTQGSLGATSASERRYTDNGTTVLLAAHPQLTRSHHRRSTCRQHGRHVAHPRRRCRSPRSEGQRAAAPSAPHPLPTTRPNPSGAGTRGGRPTLTDADSSAVQDGLGVPHGGTERDGVRTGEQRCAPLAPRVRSCRPPRPAPPPPTAARGADRGGPRPHVGCRRGGTVMTERCSSSPAAARASCFGCAGGGREAARGLLCGPRAVAVRAMNCSEVRRRTFKRSSRAVHPQRSALRHGSF